MPTANAEDPSRFEGIQRRDAPRPFRRHPPIRSSPRRSPSAYAEKLLKIDPRSGRKLTRVKETLAYMIGALSERDVFGLVGFHTDVWPERGSFFKNLSAHADGERRGLDRIGG